MTFSQSIKSLRTDVSGNNPHVAEVVSNTVSAVQDLKSAQELQKQLASVSKRISDNLSIIDSNPKLALKSLISNFKELICSYIYTHDKNFSPSSEINSSKDYPLASPSLSPVDLKNKITQKYSIPAFPGNLFYSAVGDNFEQHNPDLYSRFEILRNNELNKDLLNSELLVTLFPEYLIPGSNSISQQLKTAYSDLLNLDKIKQSPNLDLVDVFSIFGTKSTQSREALKTFNKLDEYLKSISYYAASNIISLFQQQNISVDGNQVHYLVWMANVKLAIKTIPSITEAIYLLFSDRPSGVEYSNLWSNLLKIPDTLASTPGQILSIINSDNELKVMYEKSLEYFNSVTYDSFKAGIGNPTGSVALADSVNTWKSQINQTGQQLGSQAVFLIGCLVCFERLKIVLDNDDTNHDLIKQVAYGGYKLSNYLYNAEPIKNGFRSIGGLDV